MTNNDVLGPLQQATHDRMTGDATLAAKIEGVFDNVPDGQQFPYVSHGSYMAAAGGEGALDRYGRRATFTLHVWSTYHGFAQVYDIVDDLVRLFERQTLTVTGHHVVTVEHEQTVTMRDPDEDLRHGVVRFAAITERPA